MYIVHADQMKEGEKIGEKKKRKKRKGKVDEIGMSAEWRWWVVGVGFLFFTEKYVFPGLVD